MNFIFLVNNSKRRGRTKNNIIQSEMDIKDSKINVVRVDGYKYISLTDLAKTQNNEAPADVVKNWLRNKETISFLGFWEELNNENFKVVEFDHFKNEAWLFIQKQ